MLGDDTAVEQWAMLKAETMVVSAHDTKRPMAEIAEVLRGAAPLAFGGSSRGRAAVSADATASVKYGVADFLVARLAGDIPCLGS